MTTKSVPVNTELLTSYTEQYWKNHAIAQVIADRQTSFVRKIADIHNLSRGHSSSIPVLVGDD